MTYIICYNITYTNELKALTDEPSVKREGGNYEKNYGT